MAVNILLKRCVAWILDAFVIIPPVVQFSIISNTKIQSTVMLWAVDKNPLKLTWKRYAAKPKDAGSIPDPGSGI